jgi:hypothetical protein
MYLKLNPKTGEATLSGLTAEAIGAEPKGGSPESNQLIAELAEKIVALEQEIAHLKEAKIYSLSLSKSIESTDATI